MQHMSGVVWHTLPKMLHGTIEGIPTCVVWGFCIHLSTTDLQFRHLLNARQRNKSLHLISFAGNLIYHFVLNIRIDLLCKQTPDSFSVWSHCDG